MKKLIYIVVLFISISTLGQTKLDSLLVELKSVKNDSAKAITYLKIGDVYYHSKSEHALYYYKKAQTLATKNNNTVLEAKSILYIAYYYEIINDYKNALDYYNNALIKFNNLNDEVKVANIYSYIGDSYQYLSALDLALENYLKSLTIFEKLNNKEGISYNFNEIGSLFYQQKNYDKALEYYTKSLDIYKELEDKPGISASYVNIGNVISDKGDIDRSIEYSKKSLAIDFELKDSLGIATNYNNIGDSFLLKKEYKKAIQYFNDGLTIVNNIKNKDLESILYLNIADTKIRQKQFNDAIPYALKSISISKEVKSFPNLYDNYLNLSKAYEGMGNSKDALTYYKLSKQYNDSIFSNEKNKRFTQLEALYNLEIKQHKIDDLTQNNELKNIQLQNQKNLTYILVGFTLLALMLAFLLYKQNKEKNVAYDLLSKQKREVQELHDKIKNNHDHLNDLNITKDKFFSIISHDLKSPFNSIVGFSDILIESFDENTDEQNKRYVSVIKKSSKRAFDLLQDLLLWARSQTGNIEFNPENINLNKYIVNTLQLLEIQASNKNIAFETNFKENCNVFADVNMLETILRNLISNAIKFTNPKGKIIVSIICEPANCIVSIKDNGVGISKNDINKLFNLEVKNSRLGTEDEIGTGLGLIICKDFIDKNNGKIWVESEVNKGSDFRFSLPNSTS